MTAVSIASLDTYFRAKKKMEEQVTPFFVFQQNYIYYSKNKLHVLLKK